MVPRVKMKAKPTTIPCTLPAYIPANCLWNRTNRLDLRLNNTHSSFDKSGFQELLDVLLLLPLHLLLFYYYYHCFFSNLLRDSFSMHSLTLAWIAAASSTSIKIDHFQTGISICPVLRQECSLCMV